MPPEVPPSAFGLWYFEHELDASGLPFFREVCRSEDLTRAALCAVRAEGGGGAVLEEAFLWTDRRSYVSNREQMLDTALAFPSRACRRLALRPEDELSFARTTTVRSERAPAGTTSVTFAAYAASVTRCRASLVLRRLFRHPQWNIGVLGRPIGALIASGSYDDAQVEWLDQPSRAGFLADPFGVERDGRLEILCERFDYRESRGHICALAWPAEKPARPPETVISLPVHMSYPFLVEEANELYCVPETSGADEIAIFRAEAFPERWSKVGVLVDGFPGLDPTVFRHDGRWWLMATRRGPRVDAELWAWHAPALIGPWTEHAQNPIKTDVRSARPAGRPFVEAGQLYRPAQDCSKTYGGRVVIQRVTCLTPIEFGEEQVTVIEPSPRSPYPRGRHTLTPVGDIVLIDGHRSIFVWRAALAHLGILLARSTSRLRNS